MLNGLERYEIPATTPARQRRLKPAATIAFLVALVVGMTPINWVSQDAGTAYAVVGPVGGTVVDKEGKAVTGCTVRITDQSGKEVDRHTSDDKGGIFFWVPDDGTYKAEISRDGQVVTTSDVDLRGGAKNLTVDIDRGTITPRDVCWWQGARFELSPGFYVPDGSSEIDRPAFTIGGNLSFPLPVGDGHLRGNFGYNATPGVDIDNKNLTHIIEGPFPAGPNTDEYEVYRFDDSGTIHRTSAGFSFEYPMWCGWNPFVAMMFEWTRFGFDKENKTITRTFPETAFDRDIRGASKDALGFNMEIGFLKDLPGNVHGRNVYAGCGITLRGTSTDFPRGDDQFRLEPGFNAHIAVDVFRRGGR